MCCQHHHQSDLSRTQTMHGQTIATSTRRLIELASERSCTTSLAHERHIMLTLTVITVVDEQRQSIRTYLSVTTRPAARQVY